MIEPEKRGCLEEAFDVLVKHNLYRRGVLSFETANVQPGEISEAIDVAAGTIQEYLKLDEELAGEIKIKKMYSEQAVHFRNQWRNAEKSVKLLSKIAEQRQAEIKRLRALLATNGIKYKKDKENA